MSEALDRARCEQIVGRAVDKAREIGVNASIALVDSGAHLKYFTRMDGAFAGAIDVSQRKAKTAALFPLPSGDFGQVISENQLLGMELSNDGLAAFHGGLPLFDGEQLIGAIGVSGGTADEDLAIAAHALS